LTLVKHFFGAEKVREYILWFDFIRKEIFFLLPALNHKNAGSLGTAKSHFKCRSSGSAGTAVQTLFGTKRIFLLTR
jgi:hypothetical protein